VWITLHRAQIIAILQWADTLSHNFSSFSHIRVRAPPSLADLWQRMSFSIMPSTSLQLFWWSWFFFHVFTFASTYLHYYCFDDLGFLFMCLHLLWHTFITIVLMILVFFSCVYICFDIPSLLLFWWSWFSFHVFTFASTYLHYYCFDDLGFLFMCLHLFQHTLNVLWMDFHLCLCVYTGFILSSISIMFTKALNPI